MDARRDVEPGPMRNRTTVERTSDRELVVTRAVNGPARLVFEAWTRPELIRRWWTPKRLSPTPDQFSRFVERMAAADSNEKDLAADQLRSTTAPMFFVHGDADGIRLQHVAEMFRLKGCEVHGDLRPRSVSRLAILPNTTHVTLMERVSAIAPMVNDFLDARP